MATNIRPLQLYFALIFGREISFSVKFCIFLFGFCRKMHFPLAYLKNFLYLCSRKSPDKVLRCAEKSPEKVL